MTKSDKDNLKGLVDHVMGENFPSQISRLILNTFSKNLKNLNNNEVLDIGVYSLEAIAHKIQTFEEEDMLIRREVSKVHSAKKDYLNAARTLERINLTNTLRKVDDHEIADINVSIAEFWFAEDDAVNAEKYINRATHVILDVDDIELVLRYQLCKARVADSKRQFLNSAYDYYSLSKHGEANIEKDHLKIFLQNSVTCAVLAPSGPRKARIMATLYKDERVQDLKNYDILNVMVNQRVITKKDVAKFEPLLEDHHKAITSDSYTVLQKAILEHNITCVSKLYKVISFKGLGKFLNITPSQAEKLISTMVFEERIKATLD